MTHAWWASLKHGGLLIAPSRLAEYFPEEPPPLASWIGDRLRRDVLRDDPVALLDTVFETVCGVNGAGQWLKGPQVPPDFTRRSLTGEAIKPRRVWRGPRGALLPVFWDDGPRLGVGRGRRTVARVAEWLRRADASVAMLTNGRQFRLIHAGLDYDAWAEWDTDLWFEEGSPGPQVTAIRALLAPEAITPPAEGKPSRLVAAILATRKGQAELSAELGERVRRAVELLIRAHTEALDALDRDVKPRHVYLAAVRVVMRMVVALFAEARELLPRGNPVYEGSYGLQALREELGRVGHGSGRERLRHRHGAWPRVLALFRLIHDGSGHEALPITRYDGALFAAGTGADADPVARALAAIEDPAHGPSDAVVHEMLELLTRSRVKVRQGRTATWVEAPVDFGDLSSEYIGILYEGLLDYELRRAAPDDPVVFLKLGDEPALPLSRLEALDEQALRGLLEKLKTKKKTLAAEDDATEEEEQEDEEEEGEEPEPPDGEPQAAAAQMPPEDEDDAARAAHQRAMAWARHVAKDGAEALVGAVIVPGQWYLVRFGGTRKGSGTFYTRPALAVPTAHRTLRPLAYVAPQDAEGRADEFAPLERWTPRLPEEILALKVCDPACGSGSFLVAALRFLTDALAESLHHHGCIAAQGDQTLVTLAVGRPGGAVLAEDLLPCRPTDEDFEPRLRARLKRYVVEQCLYGVDLDPLAVELCRLALWVETMDRELAFTFLDHKIRCGNALVGCWFDRFRDYPALAWDREGGDKGHKHGAHFEDSTWTKAVKEFRNDRLKPALRELIAGQFPLFQRAEGKTPEEIHDEALAAFAGIHALKPQDTEERARYFRDRIAGNPALARLKEAFDGWCALWFWPADRLDLAPLPRDFAAPPDEARAIVGELTAEHRFFHWELEFPDVFAREASGFDAILGNPPWDTLQPLSKEYFSNLDPLFRGYGKQEALQKQKAVFAASMEEERAWLEYNARFKALSNWFANATDPFALSFGRGGAELHRIWTDQRRGRSGYASVQHPFRVQDSGKAYTYKLFLELSHSLLRSGGRFGLIVPSGLYTDKGTTELRTELLFRSRWRWLFGFENRDKIFDIDSRFKFCPVIVEKAGETEAVQAAFMRRDVDDWAVAERIAVPYERAQIQRFSPKTFAILEIRNRRDLEILEKLYANGVLLGDQSERGWGIKYAQGDFNMTSDSHLFPPRPAWEAKGYRGDEYGRWLLGTWRPREVGSPGDPERARSDQEPGVILSQDGAAWIHEEEVEDVALPLYEGRMIGQFDFSQKGWVSGKGRGAIWREIDTWWPRPIEPQYLMGRGDAEERVEATWARPKFGFMDVGSATNTRTMQGTLLGAVPCGHSAPVLSAEARGLSTVLALASVANSLAFDFLLRVRLGGLHLTWNYLEETPLPWPSASLLAALAKPASRLGLPAPQFAPILLALRKMATDSTPGTLALAQGERLRWRVISEALSAAVYSLDAPALRAVLADCDHPSVSLADRSFVKALDPKGFWRVEKDADPELRHTVLTSVAFRDLEETTGAHGGDLERGIAAWLAQNDGDGWMLPETLRLADYGLGHDDRAKQHQPVRERLGPRFLPWQLEQSAEESWKECELHARNLLGELGFRRLQEEMAAGERAYAVREVPVRKVAEEKKGPYEKGKSGEQHPDLFE